MSKAPRTRRTRNIVIGSVTALTLVAGGVAVWAADRFLIDHVEISDVSAYEAENSTSDTASQSTTDTGTDAGTGAATGEVTGSTYTNGDTTITVSQVVTGSGSDTVTSYVANVILSDATVLRSAFANDQYGENITDKTSKIAADQNAVFAINGNYYGFRSTGIVIRNGVIYRDEPARTGLAFYTDGSVKVYDETTTSADELLAAGVWDTLSFGPALLQGGNIIDGIEDVEVATNVGNHSIQGEQPRTAVGVIDENHLVFVVVDGRNAGLRLCISTERSSISPPMVANAAPSTSSTSPNSDVYSLSGI